MLVHEVRGPSGTARGLELAFATPRAWLQTGKQIAVHDAPTSFGRLSYTVAAKAGAIDAWVDVPESRSLKTLKLRLRLPRGQRLAHVDVEGQPSRFDARTGTIDLSGLSGNVFVEASYTRGLAAPDDARHLGRRFGLDVDLDGNLRALLPLLELDPLAEELPHARA